MPDESWCEAFKCAATACDCSVNPGIEITLKHKREAVVSTDALIVILSAWTSELKLKHDRGRAAGMLRGWLRKFQPGLADEDILQIAALTDSEATACTEMEVMAPDQDMCCHAAHVLAERASTSPLSDMTQALLDSINLVDACESLRLWVRRALPAMSKLIAKAILAIPVRRDALGASMPVGRKKKRRLDEDFVKELIFSTQEVGRSMGGAGYQRATQATSVSTVAKHTNREMALYRCQCWQRMENVRFISVSYDASRFGNPGKDYLAMLIQDVQSNCAVVAPPMAPV